MSIDDLHDAVVQSRRQLVQQSVNSDTQRPLPDDRRFFCNRCAGETVHACKTDYSTPHLTGEEEFLGGYLYLVGYRLWQCAGCGECLLQRYIADDDWSGDENELQTEVFPERTKFHAESRHFRKLPDKLDNIYRETLHGFNHKLAVLCAAGIRALLEGICQDKSIDGANLKQRIDKLNDLLPSNIVENLHAFRFIGNTAVHELTAPSQQDLRLALEICEDLLNFLYELDYKTSQLRESVDRDS